MTKIIKRAVWVVPTLVFALQEIALAQSPCLRYATGSMVSEPEDLYSKDGVLVVNFTYQTYQDDTGKTYFCFVNSDGVQSPTLHVQPGDTLKLTLTNLVPEGSGKHSSMPAMEMAKAGEGACGDLNMTSSSVNIHYHGTNTPPICHQDEVIHTIVNSGQTFEYEVHIPKNEPPGLYWYHPHIHGLTNAAVQGGASGALIVEGIENVNPAVAGLPQRVLVVREEPPAPPPPDDDAGTNLSVNYVVIAAPAFVPAQITMAPGGKEFWRVVNSCAHTILDLQVIYDGSKQPLEVIGLDSVPLGSQNGSGRGEWAAGGLTAAVSAGGSSGIYCEGSFGRRGGCTPSYRSGHDRTNRRHRPDSNPS